MIAAVLEAKGMASIMIRNVDPLLRKRLRVRAAENGRSIEDEIRVILEGAVGSKPGMSAANIVQQFQARFGPLAGMGRSDPEPSE